MGWAHEGAAISPTARTATWTGAVGLGGGGLESTTACWVNEVPGPTGTALGPSSGVFEPAAAVPGPAMTVVTLEPSAKIPVPSSGALEEIDELAFLFAVEVCTYDSIPLWVLRIQGYLLCLLGRLERTLSLTPLG